ncbi:MAG: hypothetical protein P4M08_10290 [Oligoflexia bacterium]|nr:hypothetical protein [Oligoflexia bacterium]
MRNEIQNPGVFDPEASSVTIDAGGVSENTYHPVRSFRHPPVQMILAALYDAFPETLREDIQTWEMVGMTLANGDNYRADTISVFYAGGPASETLDRFETPQGNYVNAHTIKYELATRKKYLKVFDGDWWKYPLPPLPVGAQFGEHGGIGLHYKNAVLESRRDIYFFHRDENAVIEWCRGQAVDYPLYAGDPGGPILRLYGLAFDQQTLRVIKLKRYVHPWSLDIQHGRRM